MTGVPRPGVSVVVPTYGRAERAGALVARLLPELDAVDGEVVVVEDGSPGGPSAEVGALAEASPRVRYVWQENRGVAAARNRGAREARAARIVFLDDDAVPPAGFLARHLEEARRHGGAWIAGGQELRAPRPGPMDRLRLELESGWREAEWGPGEGVTGANLGVQRDELLELGGFHEGIATASAEDYLLALAAEDAGIRVVRRPALAVAHADSVDGPAYARRQERYAEATARLPEWAPRLAASARRYRLMAARHEPHGPFHGPVDRVRRAAGDVLASSPALAVLDRLAAALEAVGAPLPALRPVYRLLMAGRTRRGWRRGARAAAEAGTPGPSAVGADRRAPGAVTAVVVSYRTPDLLLACLRSLEGEVDRIVVVDNASGDGSAELVAREHPGVTLVRNPENVGFARANNQVLEALETEYALLLNADAEVRPGAVATLRTFLEAHPAAAVASGGLDGPDGRPQHPGRRFPTLRRALAETLRLHRLLPRAVRGRWLLGPYWSEDRPLRCDWVWGTFLLVRRPAVEEVGGFDPRHFMYGEDIDWCTRMWRHGWTVWVVPEARARHQGAASASRTWDEVERSARIWDETYAVVRKHRGAAYERALRLAHYLAYTVESLVEGLKGRGTERGAMLAALARYQLRQPPVPARRS